MADVRRAAPRLVIAQIEIDSVEKYKAMQALEQKYFHDMVKQVKDSGATLASANGFLGPKYGWASDVASSAVQRPSSTGSTALLDSFILVQGVEWQMELPVRCAHSHSATPSRNKDAG